MTISITFLGAAHDGGGSGTTQGITDIDTTGAKAVILLCKHEGAAATITVAGNNDASGTWTSLTKISNTGGDCHAQAFYKLNPTGAAGDDPVMTLDSARTWKGIAAWKVTTDGADVQLIDNLFAAANTDPIDLGDLDATAAHVAAMLVAEFGQGPHTAGTGWTERDAEAHSMFLADRSGSSGGTIAADCDPAGTADSVGVAVLFQEAGIGASTDQEGFAFGDDDGGESTHTLGTQEANLTAPTGVNKILRALLNATGDAAGAAYTLRAQKNGSGGYVAVPVGPGNAETYAQPTWGAVGTAASGTTSCAPAYPTGISASTSKLFCLVTGRSNTANTLPTMPAGWTRIGGLEGGTGTWGVDTGPRRVDFFQKDTVLGTETGTVTVSLAGTTANTLRASIFRVEVTSGYGIDVALVSGADTTNDTSYSAAASASATFDSNRLVLVGVAQNIDSGTNSAQSISASGITFGTLTSRANTAVTNGNDHRHLLWSVPVSSGSGTVAPTFVYTISAAGSGPTAFLVLRGRLPAVTNELYIAPSSNITAGGEATTARLTPPSGKTTSDFVAGRRWDDENGADSLDITADDYTEVGWCLQTQSPATNGDYWDFRVYAGASPLDTYSVTPRWTIGTPAAPDYPFGSRATYLDPDPDLGYALAEWREPEQFFAPQWREIGPDIRTTSVSGRLRVGSADSTAKTGAADMLGRLGARGQGAAEKSIATDVAGTLRPRGTDAAGKFAAHDQAGRLRAAGGDDTAKRGQNDQAGRLAQQGAVLTLKVGGTSIAGAFSARGAAVAAKTGGADQNGRLHLRGATSFTPAGSASTDVSARLRLIGSASAGKIGGTAVLGQLAPRGAGASVKIGSTAAAGRLSARGTDVAAKTGTADQAGVARLRGASTFTLSGVGSTDVSALLRLRGSSSAAKLSGTATQGQLAGRGAAAGAKIGAGTAAGRVDARGAEDAAKIGITSVAARMAPLGSSSYSREGSGATAVAGAVRLFGATNAVKIGGTVIAGRLSVRGNMQTAVDFALDLRYVVRALRRGWDARRLGTWDARRLGAWDARERRE